MKNFKFLLVLLVCLLTLPCYGQGPLRRLGHAIVEHRPVRTVVGNVIKAQPVRSVVRAVVEVQPVRSTIKAVAEVQPVRSVLKNTIQVVSGNYGTCTSNYSYGSSGYGSTGYSSTGYGSTGYGSTGYGSVRSTVAVSYGSVGNTVAPRSVVSTVSCPCGPKCQCDVGGTPCPCPKKAECVDCNTKGTEPPVTSSTSSSVAPPITMGAKNEEPFEYSGTEASDNFHRAVVTAIIEAKKEGKISRINAFALRGAMHLPSFQEKVKTEVIKKGKETGQIPLNATPEEVGKIDFSKIDWIALIKALLPIILTFL